MGKFYKFKKLPGNLGQVQHHKSDHLMPDDIYEYAKAFRSVYTRSMPLLKKVADYNWATSQEIEQLNGKAQSLAVQIAMSDELLLKAVILGSTREFRKEHNLKRLVNSLDTRYQEIVKKHLKDNGLKEGHWNKVLNMSAQTFVTARYGFESEDYALDFITLTLLNEALDNIFNNYLPDWMALTRIQRENKVRLKKEVDLVFDEDYQKEQARQIRSFNKAFKDFYGH